MPDADGQGQRQLAPCASEYLTRQPPGTRRPTLDAKQAWSPRQREPTEQWGYDKLMATLRETLSEDAFAQLATEGAAWSEDQAVEEA